MKVYCCYCLSVHDGNCPAKNKARHREYNTLTRNPGIQRLYNTKEWKRLRQNILKMNPVCVMCGCKFATDVDHIVPHKGDTALFYDTGNLQPLCHECHSRKTLKEIRST